MDRGAWWAAVHGVARSRTRLSDFTFTFHSCIGEGNGNPLHCSCLENPRDGGAWWAAVCGVTRSWTWLKRLSSSSSSMSNNGNSLGAELWMCSCLFLLGNAGIRSYWFLPLLWSYWLFKAIVALGRKGRNRENWNNAILSVLTKIIAIFLE